MASKETQDREWKIRPGVPEDFPKIEPMWNDFYSSQRALGLFTGDAPDGFKDWTATMKTGLGRFSCLFVVELGDEVIGYAAGWLKTLPAFQGGLLFGSLTEIYISEGHRSKGIGQVLLETGARFFADRGINRVEGFVLPRNVRARKAYQEWGWKEEIIQIVWQGAKK